MESLGLTRLVNPVDHHFDTEFGDLRGEKLIDEPNFGMKKVIIAVVSRKEESR